MALGLTLAAIRAAAIREFPSLIRTGMSASQAISHIRERYGRAYRETTFREDYRNAKAAFDFRPILARHPETERIPREMFAPTNRFTEQKFQYVVSYAYVDALDKRTKSARFMFSDSHMLSKQEAFEKAKSAITEGKLGAGTKDPTVGTILAVNLEGAFEYTKAPIGGKKARRTQFREEAEE